MAGISNLPRGLISLTGLNDLGQVPKDLSETLAGTIDITQFLLLNREVVSNNITITGTGSALALIVPAGELWYVHSFTALGPAIAAGDRFRLSVGIALFGNYFQQSESSPLINTVNDRIGVAFRMPVWVGPGTALATFTEAYTSGGGGFSTACCAAITRLRV
jgi:hypothetical protein